MTEQDRINHILEKNSARNVVTMTEQNKNLIKIKDTSIRIAIACEVIGVILMLSLVLTIIKF
tara:strand:+ start:872 stop:1057 length:186 start_codon:yes stop_codon:yes gene_type:complete